jgi:site-specific DNA-methyltransferase (adenine-specific)
MSESDQSILLLCGDCRERSAELREERGDWFLGAMISDPPYDLNFMDKNWDSTGVAFDPLTWKEVFLALEPGGILKAFSATRTYHRMIPAILASGFVDAHLEAWVQGEGFPKGLNISKALDKLAGATRKVVGEGAPIPDIRGRAYGSDISDRERLVPTITEAATEAAKLYEGYNVALKPSWEPIVVARKPW